MSTCSRWKYKNISKKEFENLQKLGKNRGFSIPSSPSGNFTITIASFRIGFRYEWDYTSHVLWLTCESKPVLLGCSTIKSFADQIIRESGGQVG